MIWLAWRRHRLQTLAAVVGLGCVAAFLVPTGLRMHAAFERSGLPACVPGPGARGPVAAGGCNQLGEAFAGRFLTTATASLLLLFLPLLAGMLWGAPLVAREVEQGTHRLVWTQGVTRLRWAAVETGAVAAGVLAAAAVYALLVSWWATPLNRASGYRFTWLFFDQQGVVPVGYALFALALGVFAGAVTRRVLAAMAVTLGGFLAARIAVAVLARPRFLPPLRRSFPVVTAAEPDRLLGDWVISRAVYSAQGVKLTPGGGSQALCDPGNAAACLAKYGPGAYNLEIYQPAGRFWLFQGLEVALFVLLAVLLLVAAVHWVRRRIA